jgi:hypothetical protein
VQAPGQDHRGRYLDPRVEPEADQADRAGDHTGGQGDDAFHRVPRQGEAVEHPRPVQGGLPALPSRLELDNLHLFSIAPLGAFPGDGDETP